MYLQYLTVCHNLPAGGERGGKLPGWTDMKVDQLPKKWPKTISPRALGEELVETVF